MSESSARASSNRYQRFLRDLPQDWQRMSVRQLGAVVGGGTPSRNVTSFWQGETPWATPREVSGRSPGLLWETSEHITASALSASGANMLPTGSLMITTRATLGARAINAVPMATNQGFKSIIFDRPEDAWFYLHAFEKVTPEISRRASGTTFLEISGAEFGAIQLPSPPRVEKRKIAEILDTLDTVIHASEALIAKLKAVKQGLLHDLLTRGIDANGELRPPQPEAPHLYKPSPLGLIPIEWDVAVFGDTVEHVIDFRGRTPKKLGMNWGGGEILALSANNVQPGGIDVSREAYMAGESLYKKWMTKGDVRRGDVLLTTEAPIGNVAQIPDDSKYILSQRVIALRFNSDAVLDSFAFLLMHGSEFRYEMLKCSTGSTAAGIKRAELFKLLLKIPPIEEQTLIVSRLLCLDARLSAEMEQLAKVVQQKTALMDDLLSGRVRVTPILDAAIA